MKVVIIGVGGLGGALAHGLAKQPREQVELVLVDRNPGKLAPFAQRATIVSEPVAAVQGADVVMLVVKPKVTPALGEAIAGAVGPDTLVVSCAAGVPVSALPGASARAMPSIGAAAGASTTGYFLGARCVPARDRPRIEAVLAALGPVREVKEEGLLHPVTALAASGPAFFLRCIEAMVEAGVAHGLERADALTFAAGAVRAAAARLEDGVEPGALRTQVTSPNGTTAAGLARLEEAGVPAAFEAAVTAAVVRSRELAG